MLLSCKPHFRSKSYLFRATTNDHYAYRELRLYQDSVFEFLLDPKGNHKTKLFTGKYFIKMDTLNLQYDRPDLKDRVSQMVITQSGLYTPHITDVKGMKIQFNGLPKSNK